MASLLLGDVPIVGSMWSFAARGVAKVAHKVDLLNRYAIKPL